MSLIDREKLLEAIRNKYGATHGEIFDIITNAPAVDSEIEGLLDDTQSLANQLLRAETKITELQASNKRLQARLIAEKEYVNELLKSSNHLFVENEKLKASNNRLREALVSLGAHYHPALSATPSQSLTEHDNEMMIKQYRVKIRRELNDVKPEAEQIDGNVYKFYRGWVSVPRKLPYDEMRQVIVNYFDELKDGRRVLIEEFWNELLSSAPKE